MLFHLIFKRIIFDFFIAKPLKTARDAMFPCTPAPARAFRLKSRRQADRYRRWLRPEVCPFRSCEGRPPRLSRAWESIFPARKALTTKTFHHIKDVGALRFTFNYMFVSREPKHPHYRVHELFSWNHPPPHSLRRYSISTAPHCQYWQIRPLSYFIYLFAHLFIFVAAFIRDSVCFRRPTWMCLDVRSEHILRDMVPDVTFPIFFYFCGCVCVCCSEGGNRTKGSAHTMMKYSERDQRSRLEESLRGDDVARWGRKYLFWATKKYTQCVWNSPRSLQRR